MNGAFNMQTEIAKLAERIVGPVTAKLAQKELDAAPCATPVRAGPVWLSPREYRSVRAD